MDRTLHFLCCQKILFVFSARYTTTLRQGILLDVVNEVNWVVSVAAAVFGFE